MAGNNKNKYWGSGLLKSRGWTEALMAELLPQCRYMNIRGRRVRCWDKATVLEAEQTERFKRDLRLRREVAEAQKAVSDMNAQAAVEAAAEFLESCRPAPGEDATAGELLAEIDARTLRLLAAALVDQHLLGHTGRLLGMLNEIDLQPLLEKLRHGLLNKAVGDGLFRLVFVGSARGEAVCHQHQTVRHILNEDL